MGAGKQLLVGEQLLGAEEQPVVVGEQLVVGAGEQPVVVGKQPVVVGKQPVVVGEQLVVGAGEQIGRDIGNSGPDIVENSWVDQHQRQREWDLKKMKKIISWSFNFTLKIVFFCEFQFHEKKIIIFFT